MATSNRPGVVPKDKIDILLRADEAQALTDFLTQEKLEWWGQGKEWAARWGAGKGAIYVRGDELAKVREMALSGNYDGGAAAAQACDKMLKRFSDSLYDTSPLMESAGKAKGLAKLTSEQARGLSDTLSFAESAYKEHANDIPVNSKVVFTGGSAALQAPSWIPKGSLPAGENGAEIAKSGFYMNGEASMRMTERIANYGGKYKNTAVIAFSGSDDLIDFVQDAHLAAAMKAKGPEGFKKELLEMAGKIADATVKDFAAAPKEITLNHLERKGHDKILAESGELMSRGSFKSIFRGGMETAKEAALGGLALAAAPVALAIGGAAQAMPEGLKKVPGVGATIGLLNQGASLGVLAAAEKLGMDASGIDPRKDWREVAKALASRAEARMMEESPKKHYEKLEAGNKAAIDGILKNWKAMDEINVSGHSLGGHLAGRFAAQLLEEIDRRKASGELPKADAAAIEGRIKLNVFNSIGHEPKTLELLSSRLGTRFAEYREPGDLTEIAAKSNGLSFPKEPNAIYVAEKQDQTATLSAFRLGDRHSNAKGFQRAAHILAVQDTERENKGMPAMDPLRLDLPVKGQERPATIMARLDEAAPSKPKAQEFHGGKAKPSSAPATALADSGIRNVLKTTTAASEAGAFKGLQLADVGSKVRRLRNEETEAAQEAGLDRKGPAPGK